MMTIDYIFLAIIIIGTYWTWNNDLKQRKYISSIERHGVDIKDQLLLIEKHEKLRKIITDDLSTFLYLRISSDWELLKDPMMFTEPHMKKILFEVISGIRDKMNIESVLVKDDLFNMEYYEALMIDSGMDIARTIHKELVIKIQQN